ncbi:MAG: ROK family protein [Gammaproteobacteria bacterium]|nr:ROK family protein [Gammaproteobacteria bacterium]MBV8306626.1 ROK family protein [Gammaproteobacteria bacterium]MBV8402731.1 ROK family protein [Gammaproteobacteria bacterium]
MPARSKAPRVPERQYILVIDIGGSHVKFRVGPHGGIQEFESGPSLTPGRMTRRLRKLLEDHRYDAVSMGYPGLVYHGRIAAEPHNLGKGWVGYDFAAALRRPVRLINDAAMQAIGSYHGGRMLFLGLGTGLGATLIIDGVIEPTEVGHMPYKHGRTFEDYVGERGRERLGNHRWRKAVREVIADLSEAFEADYIVVGGGNARRLKKLPRGVRLGGNLHAFAGGLRLWDPHSGLITSYSAAVREARRAR